MSLKEKVLTIRRMYAQIETFCNGQTWSSNKRLATSLLSKIVLKAELLKNIGKGWLRYEGE